MYDQELVYGCVGGVLARHQQHDNIIDKDTHKDKYIKPLWIGLDPSPPPFGKKFSVFL